MDKEDYKIAYENVMIANKMLNKERERLNNIIKEAIEYIEIIQHNESYGVKEKDYLKLLDILKGGQ